MSTNTRNYFLVGSVVLLAIAVLVYGMLFLNDTDPRVQKTIYHIRFDQVSTLADGNPVKVNGVKLGKVSKMELLGNKVIVSISIRNNVKIPVDSRVKVMNIGLMGERQIGIYLGEAKTFLTEKDTVDGQFDSGISEAMGYVGEVMDSTRALVSLVRRIVDSTIATPRFTRSFHDLLDRTEALEIRIAGMIDQVDPVIARSLGNLETASAKINQLLDENREPIIRVMEGATSLTEGARNTLQTVDSISLRLARITSRLESKDNTIGILLNDDKLHKDLSSTIHTADSLFHTILDNGLDVNIDLF